MNKSAAAFKRATHTIVLPSSKLEVEVRKPDIKRLVLHSPKGEVPTFLTQIVINGLNGKSDADVMAEIAKMPDDDKIDALSGLDRFNELVIKAALVWPVLSDNPDYEAGEIALTDLDEEDQVHIATWGMPQNMTAASKFRQQPSGDVETASDVPTVPTEAV